MTMPPTPPTPPPTTQPPGHLPAHRKLSDERLHQAFERCPDDGTPMVPTGDAYSEGLAPSSGSEWFVAFRCPQHPGETIRVWNPRLGALLDEVLDGVDVSSLPVVGPGLV